MINWLWKNKIGSIAFTAEYNGQKIKTTYQMYRGSNCLCVLLYEYQENGKNMYSLFNYWDDFNHLKKYLGLDKRSSSQTNYYDKASHLQLNSRFTESLKIATLFMKACPKIDVHLSYEEMKEEDE